MSGSGCTTKYTTVTDHRWNFFDYVVVPFLSLQQGVWQLQSQAPRQWKLGQGWAASNCESWNIWQRIPNDIVPYRQRRRKMFPRKEADLQLHVFSRCYSSEIFFIYTMLMWIITSASKLSLKYGIRLTGNDVQHINVSMCTVQTQIFRGACPPASYASDRRLGHMDEEDKSSQYTPHHWYLQVHVRIPIA